MKTIRLNDNYRIKNGLVERFATTGEDLDDCEWAPSKYMVGARALLVSETDVSPNAIGAGKDIPHYYLDFSAVEDGLGGNTDSSIKRHHGWRGTTNDISVDAHGVVRIVKIRELKNGTVSVTVKEVK